MTIHAINESYHLRALPFDPDKYGHDRPYHIDFEVLQVLGTDGATGETVYVDWSGGGNDPAASPDDATPLATGSVKWDHCPNWNFDDCVHTCSAEELKHFGETLAASYDIAATMMEMME